VLVTALTAAAFTWVASPSFAQQAPPVRARAAEAESTQAKFQMRIREGVLENAVQHGAQLVSTQMRMISPDIALFSGPARARGFRLDTYGVFFAVDVPSLHRSVSWSVRTLNQSNAEITRALQSIRRMVQNQHDARMKTELEQALRLVELQVGPPNALAAAEATGAMVTPSSASLPAVAASTASDGAPERRAPAPLPEIVENPSAAYTEAVQRAIADAMLDYGATLRLGGDEWLTVAARENSDSMLAGDLTESVTITLRVRASDLEALKAGRMSRDEVRQRLELREF
jgi:hypothetical protein